MRTAPLGSLGDSEVPIGDEENLAEDVVHGWTLVYPHLRYEDPAAAIAWLGCAFGLRERPV